MIRVVWRRVAHRASSTDSADHAAERQEIAAPKTGSGRTVAGSDTRPEDTPTVGRLALWHCTFRLRIDFFTALPILTMHDLPKPSDSAQQRHPCPARYKRSSGAT